MKKSKIIIVGAGPGGLATAMLLGKRGLDVHVYEKASQVGGRNARLQVGEFIFDTGPTFFVLPAILREIFREAGENLDEYVNIMPLDPMYRLQFDDLQFDVSQNRVAMREQIARLFPGNEDAYERFLDEERVRFSKIFPLLQKKYTQWSDFFDRRVFAALPHVNLGKTVMDVLGEYFTDERLQLAFTFQSKYLGMSPWKCPGLFSILPYIEHEYGVFHVEGGLNTLSQAMAAVAEKNGVTIHLNAPVEEIVVQHKKVKGVRVGGEEIYADEVVVNADFSYAANNLFPKGTLKKWAPEQLEKKTYSCSTFMLYLGLNKEYDAPHNTIVFSKDYKAYVESIQEDGTLVDDISFYVCNPSAIDKTMAPKGKSALYILVPISNNRSGIDWKKETPRFRDQLLTMVEKKMGMAGLRDAIEVEKVITPADWEVDYNVFLGAVFNLGHQIHQMLYWRPRNKFEEVDNCYLAGGGTHPGSGLPTIYESGRITANLISHKYGIPYTEPSSLPHLHS